jgi:predicted RNase H-like nuclease
MPRIAGVDGCPAGWICLVWGFNGRVELRLLVDAEEVVSLASRLDVLAIDIPIGLPDAGRREIAS